MAVEKQKEDQPTLGIVGQRYEFALRRAAESYAKKIRVDKTPVQIFTHAAVTVGITLDLETGTMRARTWAVNLTGGYSEVETEGGFSYWSQEYVGAENTPENMAGFAAEAADQLESHKAAIRRSKLRGEKLIIH